MVFQCVCCKNKKYAKICSLKRHLLTSCDFIKNIKNDDKSIIDEQKKQIDDLLKKEKIYLNVINKLKSNN